MDPYLERHWADVHTRPIGYVADALQPQLADDLIARMEEKVYVDEAAGDPQTRRPDVRVVEHPTASGPGSCGVATAATTTAVLDEPIELDLVGDPIRERSVLIYDAAGRRVVTAIEVLSPWNKSPGKAVAAYLYKREQYLTSNANVVEIDLIRTGDWTSMIGDYRPPKWPTTYVVSVSRADSPSCFTTRSQSAQSSPRLRSRCDRTMRARLDLQATG